jgi:hypothetical protein
MSQRLNGTTPGFGSKLKNLWSRVTGTRRVYQHPRAPPSNGRFYPPPPRVEQASSGNQQSVGNNRRAATRRASVNNNRSPARFYTENNGDEEDTLEWRITHTPNIQLTGAEYVSLTPAQRALGWTKISVQTGRQEYTDMWRRRTANNTRRERENSLNWRIAHAPNIQLTGAEYVGLTPAQRALGWTKISVQTGMQEYTDMWRRRTANNTRRERENSLNWRVAHNPAIQLTREEYRSLTAEQKALGWKRISVQMGLTDFEHRWVRDQ